MFIDFKILKRFLIAGILIGIQGCASASMSQYFEKPYFASAPAQVTQADREIFDRALFRQTNNRIQPAIKVWSEFLEKNPRSFEAHNNLGLVYFEDDQVDAAIAELETAMSLEPTELKIKNNLIRVLKFKSTLYAEANDYNGAVDTLKRVQEMSPPEQKEKIGFRIEGYEDKAFEQAKRINTLYAYEGFLKRYPDSSKNSEEARRKVEELKSVDIVSPAGNTIPEDKAGLIAPPAEDLVPSPESPAKVPFAKLENGGMNAENSLDTISPVENTIPEDNAGLIAPPAEDFVPSPESPANPPVAKVENEGLDAEDSMLEGSLMGEGNKENMAKTNPTVKDLTKNKMESAAIQENPSTKGSSIMKAFEKLELTEKTPPVVESLDQGFIPVQPLEVPRSAEQKIEIATQPEPKPATGVDLFPSLNPDAPSPEPDISIPTPIVSSPAPEDFPEVAQAPQRQVRIVTRENPLRVREDPTLDSRILTTLPKGSLVPFLQEENGWYKVEFSAGQRGWISKKYAQLVE